MIADTYAVPQEPEQIVRAVAQAGLAQVRGPGAAEEGVCASPVAPHRPSQTAITHSIS